MDNNTSKENGKLIIALSRSLQHIHRKSEQLFYQNDLTMTQFAVLESLYHKGDLTIKQIISAVLSSSGNITVVIRNLERRGLVCRLNNAKDKRSYCIFISDEGKAMFEPIFRQHMQLVSESLGKITSEEKGQVYDILKKLFVKEGR